MRRSGRQTMAYWDGVKEDMRSFDLSEEDNRVATGP